MLRIRNSFTQGSHRPINGLENMTKLRNSNYISDTKFSNTMAAQAGDFSDKPKFTPRTGISDTTGITGNSAAITGRLRPSGTGFQMGHSLQPSIRIPIDESVFRGVLQGRLNTKMRSVDSIAFQGKKS